MFLIRSLALGGAERQLALLAAGLDPLLFDVCVMTFYPGGAIWDELQEVRHVHVATLGKRGRWDNLECMKRLVRKLHEWRPAIIHSYLVEPSIIALIAGRLARVRRVVWGVRASNVDYRQYEFVNWLAFRAAGALSRFPDRIIVNSEAGRRHHLAHGYSGGQFETIPNGVDTDRFQPAPEIRRRRRAEWGVRDSDVLVGIIARLDPIKGHEVFLRAAELLKADARFRFVCVGPGSGDFADHLRATARDLGLASRLQWLGERPHAECLYPAFDLVCSPSLSEGFSNVVAEAMACSVPCVVTDVGDSAQIVGDAGLVVRPNDSEALSAAILEFAAMPDVARDALCRRARERVVTRFGVRAMIERTSVVYQSLLAPASE